MSDTPRTDAAYFKQGATMYDLAGESKKLERELAAAKAECDLNRTRIASLFWSGALDKYTGCDVQKWAAEYTVELAAMTARAEKAEADTARMDWLEKESPEDWCIRSITRDAIDAALAETKEDSK